MPKTIKTDIFLKHPPEIIHRILSHLNIKDLAVISSVSSWLNDVVTSFNLNYKITSIKKITFNLNDHSQKIIVITPHTSTYRELQKKLNLQVPHKEEWTQIVETIIKNNDPIEVAVEAMRAIAVIMMIACLPIACGSMLDKLGLNTKENLFGFSGFEVGYFLTMLSLISFSSWMLYVVSQHNETQYQAVQLIRENDVTVKPSVY